MCFDSVCLIKWKNIFKWWYFVKRNVVWVKIVSFEIKWKNIGIREVKWKIIRWNKWFLNDDLNIWSKIVLFGKKVWK